MVTTAVRRASLACLVGWVASFAFAATAAKPVFDDLLNYPVIDQQCPPDLIKEEGLGLVTSGQGADMIVLSSTQPIGQTLRLGADADVLWRICVGLCHWPGDWDEGEAVTFALWDGPEKRTQLYERTLSYRFKWHKWDVPFDCHVPARPNTSYYFELTHNGAGDGRIRVARIPRDAYPGGQAYVAGTAQPDFDLYFVALSKPKGDRIANLQRFLDRFDLEHPDLAEAASARAAGDLERACTLALRVFEEHLRRDPRLRLPERDAPFDTRRAELLVEQGRWYRGAPENDVYLQLDEQTTWREVWPESADYVNRSNDVFAELGRAFYHTGDERYARKLDPLMRDFVQDNASPFEGGMRGGRWVAMFIAWRLGDAWDGLAYALDSKDLSDDARLAWLDYWSRMADFANREPSGGNHANAVAEALLAYGYRFPLFANAVPVREWAFDRLVRNSLDLFREDGGCVEPAMNYHGYSLATLESGLETATRAGVTLPEAIERKLELALAYTAYMLMPNGQIPSYGDTDCQEFAPGAKLWNGWREGEALRGATRFGRRDLLYIATSGAEGERPTSDSYCFPHTGHYVLRSGWGGEGGAGFEDERYLFLRAGYQGSHGHWDLNQVTLYAYGRPLLLDPGRTTYGTPLMKELSRARSHNVLLVDGLEMRRADPTVHAWRTSAGLDLVDAAYEELYAGVDHRRAVVFVRPDYYVLFDRAEADGPRTMGINFWLVPPDLTGDPEAGFVHTNDPDGANLLVRVLSRDALRLETRHGTVDLHGVRDDMPVATFWRDGAPRAEFVSLLYPAPGRVEAAAATASLLPIGEMQACQVRTATGTDLICYGWEPGTRAEGEDFAAEARAALVRVTNDGRVSAIALADGVLLRWRGETLVRSEEPVAVVSVQYASDRVTIDCPAPVASLRVAALGRKTAFVNGMPVMLDGEWVAAFVGR